MQEIQDSKSIVLDGIASAVSKAQEGAAAASHAGEAIDSVAAKAAEVGLVVADVSNVLSEQKHAASEIAQHIERLSAKAESSLAIADNVAEKAQEMNGVVSSVRDTVGHFKLS
ncbi:hypothetical protein [Sulfurirhabdus autotrophica]|uniref:Methyl-accepting chemotaxis protein n=1 Tax=Sulfurirhabdus autotrophica TaxID=1706046 RepID=A0A4R3YDS3_9PROT|nr:hypothetical protein [Sulfurirhabdus autotrophica]TCV90655.1 hypothetical protein EDC63_101629 [Sulfurirhabdus autotrophica]